METSKQENIDNKEKIQALSCYSMKLDLLTNATVVSDTIKFVTEKSKLFSSLDNREQQTTQVIIKMMNAQKKQMVKKRQQIKFFE